MIYISISWFTYSFCFAGTLQRLPKLIGKGMAREMALTGERVDAQRALRYHLVNEVCCSLINIDGISLFVLGIRKQRQTPWRSQGTRQNNCWQFASRCAGTAVTYIQWRAYYISFRELKWWWTTRRNTLLLMVFGFRAYIWAVTNCSVGLEQIALFNSAFLLSDDLQEALMSFMERRKPIFKNNL